jgi:choline dehydrogenase-like flavoprotein
VVDANCRAHGIANLFIAGSSVFPAGGFANPTLLIVALALRLADNLASRVETIALPSAETQKTYTSQREGLPKSSR